MKNLAEWLETVAEDPGPWYEWPMARHPLGATVIDLTVALLNGRQPDAAVRRRAAVLAAVQAGRLTVVEGEVQRPSPNVTLDLPDGRRLQGSTVVTRSPRAAVAWVWPSSANDARETAPDEGVVRLHRGATFEVSRRGCGRYLVTDRAVTHVPGSVEFRVCTDTGTVCPMWATHIRRDMVAAAVAFAALHETPTGRPWLLGLRLCDESFQWETVFQTITQQDWLVVRLLDRQLAGFERARSRAVRLYATALRHMLREADAGRGADRPLLSIEYIRPKWFPAVERFDGWDLVESDVVTDELPNGADIGGLRDLALRALWRLWKEGIVSGTVLYFPDRHFAAARFESTGVSWRRRTLELATPALRQAPRPLCLRVVRAVYGDAPGDWGDLVLADGFRLAHDRKNRRTYVSVLDSNPSLSTLLALLPSGVEAVTVHGTESVEPLGVLCGARVWKSRSDPFEDRIGHDIRVSRAFLDRLVSGSVPEIDPWAFCVEE